MTKERPILMSAPMVRALLAGKKNQTRRIVKANLFYGEPDWDHAFTDGSSNDRYLHVPQTGGKYGDATVQRIFCPYGKPGDRLWIREGLKRPDGDPWLYAADGKPVMVDAEHETEMIVWTHHKDLDYCASIHMPRWASRITLELADVRVERVNDISEADAIAEGVSPWPYNPEQPLTTGERAGDSPYRSGFALLWDELNDETATWKSNPYVWVLGFKVTK